MDKFIAFVFFAQMLNFNIEQTDDITNSNLLIYKAIIVLIKSIYICINLKYLKVKLTPLYSILLLFIVYRVININFTEFKSVALSIDYLITFLAMIIYVKRTHFQGLNLFKLPILLFTLYLLIGYFLSPSNFSVESKYFPMLQPIIPRLNANAAGQLGLILIILYRTEFKKRKLFSSSSGIILLILAQSRASLLFLFAYLFYSKKRRVLISIILVLLTLVINIDTIREYFLRGQERDVILTMSKRTVIWAQVTEVLTWQTFIFGSGSFIGISEIIEEASYFLSMELQTIDNSYLQLIVENGIISLLFFIIILSTCLKKFYKLNEKRYFFLLLFLCYRGMFTSSLLLSSNFILLYLIVLGTIIMKNEKSNLAKFKQH